MIVFSNRFDELIPNPNPGIVHGGPPLPVDQPSTFNHQDAIHAFPLLESESHFIF
jgi:hypothetical protein